ncbi:MAG TPA: methyltransferase domain-containing protein [Candidatus Binatia bacterium]|nr:methyltransferase domain-containing protein [Candidatus Binatia bacterium]
MADIIDPAAYRRWYETPLGARADADEKAVVFGLADLQPGERVLDVGCGDGNYTALAADRSGAAVGLDRSTAMLDAAKRRLGARADIEWVHGDAERLPFPAGSFDVVLAVTVLCFAADRQAVVNEAARVLRRGGRLVLGELGCYSSWAAIRRVRGLLGSATWRHAHFFSPGELCELARCARLTEIRLRGAIFYPPIPNARLLSAVHAIEQVGQRGWIVGAAFLALCAVCPR